MDQYLICTVGLAACILIYIVFHYLDWCCHIVNSSPPEQNGCHFTNNIFRCIFVYEKFSILIKISLKFVPKGPIDNNQALQNRWQAIIWTNADPIHSHIYAALGGDGLIGPLRKKNLSETWIKIKIFYFKKRYLEMSSAKWWPFCIDLNGLKANRIWNTILQWGQL